MFSLRKDHAPLLFCTHFVLIYFNIFIYMPTYRPYPITIFARETTNQVEVALQSKWFGIQLQDDCFTT